MSDAHTIQISVDTSRARAGLDDLRRSIQGTSRDLQSLGSANSGSSFANLSRNLSSLGSGFESLRRQTSQDSGLSNLSREISMLSRGMPVAAREIVALASSFVVSRNAVTLFAGALGSVGIGKFASEAIDVGNKFMSLRMAIDSSAESSREVGQQMKFLFGIADSTGSRVEDLTNNFRNLDASMRSSGMSVDNIQKITKAFATIGSVLHLAPADMKTVIREIGETASIGAVHAQQLTRSIALHIPGMMSIVKDAMHMTGEEIHKTFARGGFDPNVLWPAVADTILQKYSTQLPEAMNHAQASLNGMSNAWTKLKLSAFDNGLDSAITQLSKHLTGLATDSAIESVGRTIGTGFRAAAAGVTILVDQIIAAKEPLLAFFGAFAVAPTIRIAMLGLGAAFAFATSPITILATLAAITAANWGKLKDSFSGSDSILASIANAIANTVARLFDLNKAAKGALEIYAMGKNLLSGNGWSASLNAARQAGAEFDASAKQSGKTFAQSWFDGAKGTLDTAAKWLEGRFAGITGEYNKLMSDSTPHGFQGAGNYAANRELYSHKDNSLSEELRREYEKLLPTTAALKHYRDTLAEIDRMKGKLYDGRVIGDAEIQKLKNAARSSAMEHLDPTASRISDKLAELKAYQDFANRGGDLSQWQAEKEILNEKLALKKKGLEMSSAEEQALRKILEVEKEINQAGGNGFTQWASSQKSAMDSLNGDIHSGLDSISNGIAKIITEGKGKFKSLGDAIKAEFRSILQGIASNLIKTGINSLMASAIKQMTPQLNQLFGGSDISAKISQALGLGQNAVDSAQKNLDDAAKSLASTNVAEMSVQAAVVNISGVGGIGATGTDAFKPSTDIGKAVNPASVGGITPTNAATAPLFKNDNSLPDFGASVKTNGLGNISADSVSMFGKGLVPSLGKLPEFGAKVASQTSAEITKNSVAEFGKLINIQKPLTATQSVSAAGLRAPTAAEELSALGRTGGSRSWRNSNPGNIEYGPFAKAHGAIGTDGRFAKFPNDTVGTKAQEALLFDSKGYKNLTLGQAIHRWAPASENNVPAYIKAMGADPSTRMGDFTASQRQTLLHNMRQHEGWKPGRVIGGNDQSLKQATQGLTEQMNQSSQKIAQNFTAKMDSAVKAPADLLKQNLTQELTQVLGQGGKGAGDIGKLTDSIKAAGDESVSAASQIGNLASKLGSLGGGGGGLGGLASEGASLIGGLFSEGGYSGSPVSSAAMPASFWAGAPAYAEGTPNTSGGMPAILHDNEAVVPLSRGRSIPVEINGAGGQTIINNNNHVTTNVQGVGDFHSFRRSQGQIMSAMQREVGRMAARNN